MLRQGQSNCRSYELIPWTLVQGDVNKSTENAISLRLVPEEYGPAGTQIPPGSSKKGQENQPIRMVVDVHAILQISWYPMARV